MDKLLCFICSYCYNANGNSNNIIFTIKDTKLRVPFVTLSAKDKQIKTSW